LSICALARKWSVIWDNGILDFWNDGLRKEHPKEEFNPFFPIFHYSSSAVVAIGYYGEVGYSNTPICNMH